MNKKSSAKRRLMPVVVFALACGLYASSGAQQDAPDDVIVLGGLMWSLDTSEVMPWREASEYCAMLDSGGYADWRLPTLAELQGLYDPGAEGSIRGPFELDDCCAWSSMNLTDLEAEAKGELPEPGGPPSAYYWGFLFSGGISYYSNGNFPDGFAMCRREPATG